MPDSTAAPGSTALAVDGDHLDANFASRVRDLAGLTSEVGGEPTDGCHSQDTTSSGCTRDLDLLDWGLLYGVAWATERLQNPHRSEAEAGGRVLRIASDVAIAWGGSPIIAPRPSVPPLVDDVLVAFSESDGRKIPQALRDTLASLSDAIGVPRTAPVEMVALGSAETETLRWLADHWHALRVEYSEIDLTKPENGETPAERLRVRANQHAVVADLLDFAESGAVAVEQVSFLVGALRVARGDRERQLSDDLDAVSHGTDLGDVQEGRRRIADIEALMRVLGVDPHAPKFAGVPS